MEKSQQQIYMIELNMKSVMRQAVYLTGFSFFVLVLLQMMIHGAFSYSFNGFTLFLDLIIFSAGYLVLLVLHEFFHLLGFRLFSHISWRNMNVGVNMKLGIAYATTNQLMENKAVQKSLLLPFWLTGVVPAIIGLAIDSSLLLILAAFLIGGAAGDFSMYRQLRAFPNHWTVQDHPSEPKLSVFPNEKINV